MANWFKRLLAVLSVTLFMLPLFACAPDNNGNGNRVLYPEEARSMEDIIATPSEGLFALKGEILLMAKDTARFEEIERLVFNNGGRLVGYHEKLGFYHGKFNAEDYQALEAVVANLKNASGVIAAIPNYFHEGAKQANWVTNEMNQSEIDSTSPNSWGQNLIRMYEAHQLLENQQTSQVNIGVLDSCLNYNHIDLRIPEENVRNKQLTEDGRTHGTHVTGIIAAINGNDLGIRGVATNSNVFFTGLDADFFDWDAELMYKKYSLDITGNSWGFVSSFLYGLKWLADKECRVINISSYIVPDKTPKATANEILAFAETYLVKYCEKNPKVLIINSAGNDCISGKDSYGFAAIARRANLTDQIIVVGAVDSKSVYASYSNYGNNVDIAAPGGDSIIEYQGQTMRSFAFTTVYAEGDEFEIVQADGVLSTVPGNTYGLNDGTSTAAPFVTGVAALILEVNYDLMPAAIKGLLLSTAKDRLITHTAPDGNTYSYPLLNAQKAVMAAIETLPKETPQSTEPKTQTEPSTKPAAISYTWFKEPYLSALFEIDVLPDERGGYYQMYSFKHRYDGIYSYHRQGGYGLFDQEGNELVRNDYTDVGCGYDGMYWLSEPDGDVDDFIYDKAKGLRRNSTWIEVAGTAPQPGIFWISSQNRFAANDGAEAILYEYVDKPLTLAAQAATVSTDDWGDQWLNASGGYAIFNNSKKMTDFIYDDAGSFSDGMCAVKKNGKWGYVNEQGTVVIPIEYEANWLYNDYRNEYTCMYAFTDGLVPIKKNGAWGYLDKSGAIAIPFEFEAARPFYKGKAFVMKDGAWGIIQLG
ncbi:MAG: S8 family serine peptidase [Oscillospiraceae bacterium]|nr:S8 family serine peptidase [Oscillospiraceae bacterium]